MEKTMKNNVLEEVDNVKVGILKQIGERLTTEELKLSELLVLAQVVVSFENGYLQSNKPLAHNAAIVPFPEKN